MPRIAFRRLFERELAALRRLTWSARRWFGLGPESGRVSRRAAPASPRRAGAAIVTGDLARLRRDLEQVKPPGGREQVHMAPRAASRLVVVTLARRWRSPAAGVSLSLVLHAALIALLFSWLPRSRPPAAPAGDAWVTVRFQLTPLRPPAPESATTKHEAPNPLPTPDPRPPVPDPPAERIAAAPLKADSTPSDVSGRSDIAAPSLAERADAPSVIGVGAPHESRGRRGDGHTLFEGRGEGRAEALARWGGGRGTEDAVQRGLAWLAAHQDIDGKWDADGFDRHCARARRCPGAGQPEFDVGVTALAVLAFLGADYRPGAEGAFGDAVDRGLRFLLRSQQPDGRFGPPAEKLFYNHALATFAVVEAWGMTRQERFLDAARRAAAFSSRGQQSRGGWDYTAERTGRNDLSVSGWQTMALGTAARLGVPVPQETLDRLRGFVDSAVAPDGSAQYASSGVGAERQSHSMRAVGMVCRLYLGTPLRDRAIAAAARSVATRPPDRQAVYEWDRTFQSSYYWYYGTLALFHVGGRPWDAWNRFLTQTVLPLQSLEDHERGSWAPDGNWIGASAGRVATTALLVLTLEVYYRYPPLHAYRPTEEGSE